MEGARSPSEGDTAPSSCLHGGRWAEDINLQKTIFTRRPFWVSLLLLSKADLPETLETTVSPRCVPRLSPGESLRDH